MKFLLSFVFLLVIVNLIIASEGPDTIILKSSRSLPLDISEVNNLGVKLSDGQFCLYKFISIIQTNDKSIINEIKRELPHIEISKGLNGVYVLDFNEIIFEIRNTNPIKYLNNQRQNSKNIFIKLEYYASIESSLLNNSKKYINILKEKLVSDIYPISLYFSGLGYITNNLALELKPGIVFGGEYYTGIELGFYLRYYLNEQKYYIGLGYNIHDNFESGHSKSVSDWATDESVDYIAFKIAYNPKYYFVFTLGYYHPLDKFSYYSISDVLGDSYKITFNHMVKVGFEFSF